MGRTSASIEIEQVLDSHPDVVESAVVGTFDERWGEVPVAYVTLRPGATTTETELIEHVKSRIARFKAPKRITFCDLPKTGTGKIQKYLLRAMTHPEVVVMSGFVDVHTLHVETTT